MTNGTIPHPSNPDLLSPCSFVHGVEALVDGGAPEPVLLNAGTELLKALVARDDWLPEAYSQSDPDRFCQYLLYLRPKARRSLVSFVWEPGQRTPVHDHTVWGLVGVLRGAEIVETFERSERGLRSSGSRLLSAAEIDAVSLRSAISIRLPMLSATA